MASVQLLKAFLKKNKTAGPGRVLNQSEIDERQEFLDGFLKYADEKFFGNFKAAAESLGESRERIRGFFQRAAGESRQTGEIGKGAVMQTSIPTPENIIPYSQATTNVKYNKNYFKEKIKDFDKSKFYTPKDLANVFGIDVSKKENLDRFVSDLKRFGVSTKQKTGQQKVYQLNSAAKNLSEGYAQKLVKGDRASQGKRVQVISNLDKPLDNFFSNFKSKLARIGKSEDVYIPNAVEDIGHPLSVKITDKYPKLTKNSNINKINTLVYQDPVVNEGVLLKTGYEGAHDAILKKLNKLVNKPLKEKDVVELQNIKRELNDLYGTVINNVKQLSNDGLTLYNPRTKKTTTYQGNYFKGQEQRIPKIDINIPNVGETFKSEDLFVDMSKVNPAYKVGYIDTINPNARFFNDLTKEQKLQYQVNLADQNKNNLEKFYKQVGYSNEEISELKDAIDFGTAEKIGLGTAGGLTITSAASANQDIPTLDSDIEFGDPDTWDMKIPQFIEEYPILTGTAATGAALATKPGREVGKSIVRNFPLAFNPLTAAGLTYGLRPEEGYDFSDPLTRVGFEAEAAFSKDLVRASQKAAEKISNPMLSRATQGILNLGLPARLAMGAARIATPLGWLSLGAEGAYQLYKLGQEEQARIDAMSDVEREAMLREQQEFAELAEETFATGGRVGFSDGSDPKDPSRRKFMKTSGGILGLATAVGTGLLKYAPQAAKEVQKIKSTFSDMSVPGIVEELYSTIRNFGKMTDYNKKGVVNYEMGPYKLEEGPEGYNITKRTDDDLYYQEEYFSVYKDPETGGVQYEELTVTPDAEGKLKDVDYGVDVQTYRDMGKDIDQLTKDDMGTFLAEQDIETMLNDGGTIIDQGIKRSGK
jgi:hypothetical protein